MPVYPDAIEDLWIIPPGGVHNVAGIGFLSGAVA
jgi:hypothetical protein